MTQLRPPRALLYSLTAGVLLVSTPNTEAETFESAIANANWEVGASAFECRLHHSIPQFGTAVFSHRAGEEQRFYLQQSGPHLSAGQGELAVQHPVWREGPYPRPLASVELSDKAEVVQLDRTASEPLMAELLQGMRLVFSRAPARGQEMPVRVLIEPVGFRPALRQYQDCLSGLLPVNYDQVARTALYYATDEHELPYREMQKLDRVALYALEDKRVTAFYIDGHTDGVGLREANLELSRKRAETVRDYLVKRGVDPSDITVRWHGERYPVANNREGEGRRENRRVTIRMERADDRLSSR